MSRKISMHSPVDSAPQSGVMKSRLLGLSISFFLSFATAHAATFTQSTWTGGATANNAVDPTNLTNWTEYQSKDTSTSAATSLSISPSIVSKVDYDLAVASSGQIKHIDYRDFDDASASHNQTQSNNGVLALKPNLMTYTSWVAKSAWNVTVSGLPSPRANIDPANGRLFDVNADFADLDGDGDVEMFVGGWDGSDSHVIGYRNEGTNANPNWVWVQDWSIDTGAFVWTATPTFGDFDKDGLTDLFVGVRISSGNGRVLGYRNTGSKAYPVFTRNSVWDLTITTTSGEVGNFFWCDMADINKDGWLDLIVGDGQSSTTDAIHVYSSSSVTRTTATWTNEAWGTANVLGATTGGPRPRVGDMNGDGQIDIIAAVGHGTNPTSVHDYLLYFENQSVDDVTYIPSWTIENGNTLTFPEIVGNKHDWLSLGDIDSDGDLDIMVAPSDGNTTEGDSIPGTTMYGYENTGTSYFSGGTYLSAVQTIGESYTFATLDYTVNTPSGTWVEVDVRAGNSASPDASWTAWSTNVATGTDMSTLFTAKRYFQYKVRMGTDNLSLTPMLYEIAINYGAAAGADAGILIDGGVQLKPISRDYTNGWTRNTAWEYTHGSALDHPVPFVEDFDNDGLEDLIVSVNGLPSSWLQLRNVGSLTAPNWSGTPLNGADWLDFDAGSSQTPVSGRWAGDIADVNGDGLKDMIINNYATSSDGYRNMGTVDDPLWIYDANLNVASWGGTRVYRIPTIGDIDADGDPDLIVGLDNGDSIPFRNDATTYPGNPNWNSIRIWDIANENPPAYWDYIHNGTADFDACYNYNDYSQPHLVDLDGDGDLDILVGCWETVLAWENTGTKEFPIWVSKTAWEIKTPQIDGNINIQLFVDTADVDHDGDPDVIHGSRSASWQYVYVMENTSTSVYSDQGIYHSKILDFASSAIDYTTMDLSAVVPAGTQLTIKVRAGNTDLPDGSWTAWTTVADGGALDAYDGKRYLQYQAILDTNTGGAKELTPKLKRVAFNYSVLPSPQELISSPYNTSGNGGYILGVSWNETLAFNSAVQVQLRTSSDGATWSSWMGPDGTSSTYWNSTDLHGGGCTGAGTITCTHIPTPLKNGDDHWFQYKVILVANGIAAPTVSDVSVDYDVSLGPGITPSKTVVTTTEASGFDIFSVVLDKQPASGNVVVNLTVDKPGEADLSAYTITFNTTNWNVVQASNTITVTGLDDAVDEGDAQPYTITISVDAANTDDPAYDVLSDVIIIGSNTDNDTAGITVTPTSGLSTLEAGQTTATFDVVLDSQPTADVVINLTSGDTSEGTIDTPTLTFTPAVGNWNVAKTVTITGVDEGIDDGDVSYNIVTSAASSTDPNYSGMDVSDVGVTNIDNDTIDVIVTPTSALMPPDGAGTALVTTEGSGTAQFSIVLGSEPTENVTLNYVTGNTSEGLITPSSVTFTPANWNVAQNITITGQDDSVADGDIAYTIFHSSTYSYDNAYDGWVAPDISVKNTDDDIPSLVVTPTSGLVTTEAQGTAQFTVKLKTLPSAPVEVGFVVSAPSEGSVSPSILYFNGGNWGQAQTVTVTGVDDVIDDNDTPYTVTVSVTGGGDGIYSAVSDVVVNLTNQDNDGAAFTDSAFSQTNWSAGNLTNSDLCSNGNGTWLASGECVAVDPANQGGWQAYKSTSGDLSVANSGNDLTLPIVEKSLVSSSTDEFSPAPSSVTHNRARHFENGTFNSAKVINSVVGLKPRSDVFASGAQDITTGQWVEVTAWNLAENKTNNVATFADLDDDGDIDMMTGGGFDNYSNNEIWTYINNGASIETHAGSDFVKEDTLSWSTGNGSRLVTPTLGDFDGDGDYDLFIGMASTFGNVVTVFAYENIGTRKWPKWERKDLWDLDVSATGANSPLDDDLRPELVDVDGDGKLDLMVGGIDGLGNQVIYGFKYDWQFSSWTYMNAWDTPDISGTYPATQWSLAVPTAGDLDHDGDLELMAGWSCTTTCTHVKIKGFENEGSSASPTWNFNLASPPNDSNGDPNDLDSYGRNYVRFVDIDFDGDLDMYASAFSKKLIGYRNDSSTYPTTGDYLSEVIDSGWPNGFKVVTYSAPITPAGTSATVYVQAGNAVDTGDASWDTGWVAVTSGDDLSLNSAFDGKQYIQYKVAMTSDGTKTPLFKDITINFGDAFPQGNNVVATHGALSLSMTRTVSWAYKSAWNHTLPGPGTTPATGDLDGDGDIDMFVARGQADGVDWYEVRNTGTIYAPTWETLPVADNTWQEGFDLLVNDGYTKTGLNNGLVDIDGDGDLDMYWSQNHSLNGHVYAYENIGTKYLPKWQANSDWAMVYGANNQVWRKFDFADLDDDGDYDAAVNISWSPWLCPGWKCNITMLRNNQVNGDDPAWQYLPANASPMWGMDENWGFGNNEHKPEFIDIDGDGDYDMLMTGGNLIHAIENIGDKKFPVWARNASWDVTLGAEWPGGTPAPFAEDMDNDGDLDLMVGVLGGNATIYAYENTSNTTYAANGSYYSNVLDAGSHLGFTTLLIDSDDRAGATTIQVDVRSGTTPVPDAGVNWTVWQTNVTPSVVNNISTHGTNRYIQYRVAMTSSGDNKLSPEVTSVTVKYNAVADRAELGSSSFNTADANNLITGIAWSETAVSNTEVKLQLRTAPASGADPGTWSEWFGPDGSSATYWTSADVVNCPTTSGLTLCSNIPAMLRNGVSNQWVQYKVTLTSEGVNQPVLSDVHVFYTTGTVAGTKVTVTPGTLLTTTEDAGVTPTQDFQISLDGTQTSPVDIYIHSGDLTEGTVSTNKLTFGAGDSAAQTVTITAVDDAINDDDITYTVFTSTTVSSDAAYNNLIVDDVSAKNVDNDNALGSVVITNLTGTVTQEATLNSISFDVQLSSAPEKDVYLYFASSDETEGRVSPASVKFTSVSYGPTTITVTAQDDSLFDQDISYTLFIEPAVSEDPNFNGADADDLTLTNIDNEEAGVDIIADDGVNGISPIEGGMATFRYKLKSQPTSNVTFRFTTDAFTVATVSPFTFETFTPSDWNIERVGTIFGANNNTVEGGGGTPFTLKIEPFSSADPNFNGVDVADIPSTVRDDDAAAGYGVEISRTKIYTTENGGSDVFRVALTSKSTSDVIINFTNNDTGEGYVTDQVVLRPDDDTWRGVQVVVTGLDDYVIDDDQVYTIEVASIVTLDPNYSAIDVNTINNVTVTNFSTNTYQAEVNQDSAHLGRAVALGDVNNDGYADMLVGAPDYDPVLASEGRVILYRSNSSGAFETVPRTIDGVGAGALLGQALAIGDVDGDGYGDAIIGAPGLNKVFIYHGNFNGVSASPDQTLDMSATGVSFGSSVAYVGDVNAVSGGYGDIIVGDPGADKAYVYHGSSSGLGANPDQTLVGDQIGSQFGHSVSGNVDIDNDGYADVLVGANLYSNGETSEGRVYAFYGSASGVSATETWYAESNQASAEFGYSVAGIGDVNSDGYGDVAVGARYYDNGESNEGRVSVFYGPVSGPVATADFTDEVNQVDAYLGYAVAAGGDINGDGFDDMLVGAPGFTNGEAAEGRAYFYYGSATGINPTLPTPLESDQAGANMGVALAGADVTQDGYSDFLVGADLYDGGQTDEGRVYLRRSPPGQVGVVLGSTAIQTTEAGGASSFSVKLSGPPVSSVLIEFYSTDSSEGFVNQSGFFVFTPADWDIPQYVPVKGVDDAIDDGDVAYSIVANVSSNDPIYDNLVIAPVSVTNVNDDFSVFVTATDASLGEAGPNTGEFTFSRTGPTTSDLAVFYSVGGTAINGTDFTGAPGTLTIPSGQSSATVVITPVDDALDDAGETISLNVIGTANYLVGGTGTDSMTIVDNDSPGITVSPVSGLVTTEAGGSASFTVVLNTQPAASQTVQISLSSDTPAEGLVSPTSLTFTDGNWNVPQMVTVVGEDDAAIDGNVDYWIVLSPAVSGDASYSGRDAADVAVTNLDNDVLPNVSIAASIASVDENASTSAVLTVSRTGSTASDLLVNFSVGGDAVSGTDYVSIGASIVIPAGSSSVGLPISPLNDGLLEGNENVSVSLLASANYIVATPTATVTIRDDDQPTLPIANFSLDQSIGEGTATQVSTATVKVALDEEALSYPVTIPYTVSGTATGGGTDHDAASGNIVISSGREGSVTFNITYDGGAGDPNETVIFTMGIPTNAQLGARTVHTVTIVEANEDPRVTLTAAQGGVDTSYIVTRDGLVLVTATVTDPNPNDTHTYDWSATNNNLVDIDDGQNETFQFDPFALTSGYYKVRVTVTDSGALNTTVDLLLKVEATAPSLTTNDSDHDGIADNLESYDDSDADGIPDYQDSNMLASHELQLDVANYDGYIMRTEVGLTLRLGDVAVAAGSDGALVTQANIEDYGNGEGGPGTASAADTEVGTGGYYDFEILGLPVAGSSVRLVIPSLDALPAGAKYRKYDPISGWSDFTEDGNNSVASAPGLLGKCPPPGDAAYTAGLTQGHYCIQLTIQDGGPNDQDGLANHVIEDPAQIVETTSADVAVSSSGGGAIRVECLLLFLLVAWRRLYSVKLKRAPKEFSV